MARTNAHSALWDQTIQRRLFLARTAAYMVSGTLGSYSFARLAENIEHAERICRAARAEGFGHLEVYRYSDGATATYRKGRGIRWLQKLPSMPRFKE